MSQPSRVARDPFSKARSGTAGAQEQRPLEEPSLSAKGSLSPAAGQWEDEERAVHVKSILMPRLPHEQQLLDILTAAFAASPLPAPWVACRESRERVVFMNSQTGKVSLSSPLDETLKELAGTCRTFMHLSNSQRAGVLAKLEETWTSEVAEEISQWVPAQDNASGRTYYYHCRSKETMWNSPAEVFLPTQYLRMKVVELLRCQEES